MLHRFHPIVLGECCYEVLWLRAEQCQGPQIEPASAVRIFSLAHPTSTCDYKMFYASVPIINLFCTSVNPDGVRLVRKVHEGWTLSKASLKSHLCRFLTDQAHSKACLIGWGLFLLHLLSTLGQPLLSCSLIRTPEFFLLSLISGILNTSPLCTKRNIF